MRHTSGLMSAGTTADAESFLRWLLGAEGWPYLLSR